MLHLSLTLLMAATPVSPADAYLTKACPPSKEKNLSHVAMKGQAVDRMQCAKKAMNRDLDRIILPLKRKAPEDYKKWMELQARYNRWMQSVCSAYEELFWVDWDMRLRSNGTAAGEHDWDCQTSLAAERGVFAARVAAGDFEALRAQLHLAQQGSEAKRAQLKDLVASIKEAEAEPTPKTGDEGMRGAPQPITPEEWHDLRSRFEVALTTAELARDQCALLPALGKGCQEMLERALIAMIPPV